MDSGGASQVLSARRSWLRAAAAIPSALILVGCELLGSGGQAPGDMLPDGSIVVNRGQLNGRPWAAFAVQRGAEVCIEYEGGAVAGRIGGCTSIAMGTGMSAEWGGATAVIEGFGALNAVVVRLETNAGAVEAPTVPLERLGVQESVYVLVLPGNVQPRRLTILDGRGASIEEYSLGP